VVFPKISSFDFLPTLLQRFENISGQAIVVSYCLLRRECSHRSVKLFSKKCELEVFVKGYLVRAEFYIWSQDLLGLIIAQVDYCPS
jgi:hypothetical protein